MFSFSFQRHRQRRSFREMALLRVALFKGGITSFLTATEFMSRACYLIVFYFLSQNGDEREVVKMGNENGSTLSASEKLAMFDVLE